MACTYITYVLKNLVPKKFKLLFIICVITILLTPATIDFDSPKLAPSLSVFLYEIILERNFSFRSLRPILITLPASLLSFWIFIIIKKRFF